MVDLRMLQHAILWTQWRYAQAPDRSRPQRPEQSGDQARLSKIIKAVTNEYHQGKLTQKKQTFLTCRQRVLELSCSGLNDPTRNFYSSVLGHYFNWRAHPEQYAKLQPSIAKLEKFRKYIQIMH